MLEILIASAAVLAAVAAAVYRGQKKTAPDAARPQPPGGDWRQYVPEAAERLSEVIDALLSVMADPALGGPGYLTVQFPRQPFAGGPPTVTAQFPNIGERLYRRVARRDLEPAGLAAIGIPEALLTHSPGFSTESGGVVVVSAQAEGPDPALEAYMAGQNERTQVLAALAEELERRYPALAVRSLGGELLLTPVRYTIAAG